jgi:chromate transporter
MTGMRDNPLWQLVLVFAPLSLVSLGGGQSIIADMDKQVVALHGWLSQADFVELFGLSRAAPGPGSLLSTLIGWRVAGWPGAVAASLAFFLPSSLIAYGGARIWSRWQGSAWQKLAERGLAPIATALMLAGAFRVLLASSGGLAPWGIAAAAAALLILRPRLSPLLVLLGAGLAEMALGLLV